MAEDFNGIPPPMDFKGINELPNEVAKKTYIRNYIQNIFAMAEQSEYLISVLDDTNKFTSIFTDGLLDIYKNLHECKNPDVKSMIIDIFQKANPDKKITHDDIMMCIEAHERNNQEKIENARK